jgi:hypothetical protein
MAQGRKGTGDDKRPIGIRCPGDIYDWLQAGKGPRETDTGRVITCLEQLMEQEKQLGPRLTELRAKALLAGTTLGSLIGELVLEALDARGKGRKR